MRTKPRVRGNELFLPPVHPFTDVAKMLQLKPRKAIFDDTACPAWFVAPYDPEHVRVTNKIASTSLPGPALAHWKYPGLRKPFFHQRQTVDFLTQNRRAFCLNDMGCVDADTEYLGPDGWHRIADYKSGPVMQYDPISDEGSLVEPQEFIDLPCGEFYHWHHSRGLDQMLSGEHRMLVDYTRSGGTETATEACENLQAKTFHQLRTARIRTTFFGGGKGADISDADLRVAVAIAADGHVTNEKTRHTVVRLKKQRKISRLRELLTRAKLEFREKLCPSSKHTVFTLHPAQADKSMADWYDLSNRQLCIVVSEAVHWDGSTRKRGAYAFSSTDKATADFMQYAAAATKRTSSIYVDRREGKPTCYNVHIRDRSACVGLVGVDAHGNHKRVTKLATTPGTRKYCFRVPTGYLVLRRNGNVFITGNSGKTSSVLWATLFLREINEVKRTLIISPLSTLRAVWVNEVFYAAPMHAIEVAHGSKAKRDKALFGNAPFVVTNHDALRYIDIAAVAQAFDHIVVDELGVFRTWSSGSMPARYKALRDLVHDPHVKRFWGLTGTPTPNGPFDAWALIRLVNPSFKTPKGKFQMEVMQQVSEYRWIPKPGATQRVSELMQPSIRFSKDDVLKHLPPMVFTDRDVPLTAEQSRLRDKMRKELTAEFGGKDITAANAAVLLGKCLQISAGVVLSAPPEDSLDFDAKNVAVELPYGPKLTEIKDLVQQTQGKTLIFCNFTAPLKRLAKDLNKAGIKAEAVYGGVAAGRRAKIYEAFQKDKDPQVIVAHPGTTAHGITLTAADLIIWAGPTFSAEWYEQANARAHRPGQRRTVTIAHLSSTPEEKAIYRVLKERGQVQSEILRLAKELA